MNESDLLKRIMEKYSGDGQVFMPQVPDGTGWAKTRTADAIVMETWPSRGLEINGFEIKVSRADVLKEMKDGAKAEAVARYCHRWWLVVPEAKIAADVLPAGWGLISAHGDGLRVRTQAPLNEKRIEPDLGFLASLMRCGAKALGMLDFEKVKTDAFEKGRKEGWAQAERRKPLESETVTHNLVRLQAQCAAFEEASGIKIDRFANGTRLGKAVHFVQNCPYWLAGFDRLLKKVEVFRKDLTEAKAELEAK